MEQSNTGHPEFLYHGTDASHIEEIFENGLKPRVDTGRSNWDVESIEKHVYLTQNYAGYFGKCASDGNRFAIYEVDYSQLEPWKLYPDEDFIEQMFSAGLMEEFTGDNFNYELEDGAVAERTQQVRDDIEVFQPLHSASIEMLGNASYQGTIPSDVIRRASIVEPDDRLLFDIMDPSISIENAAVIGEKYRVLTRFFMGEDVSPEEYTRAKMLGVDPSPEEVEMVAEVFERTEIDVRENPKYTEADAEQEPMLR